jgi:hypothetical protein
MLVGCSDPNCPIKKSYWEDTRLRLGIFFTIVGIIALLVFTSTPSSPAIKFLTYEELLPSGIGDPYSDGMLKGVRCQVQQSLSGNPYQTEVGAWCQRFDYLPYAEREKYRDKVGKTFSTEDFKIQ